MVDYTRFTGPAQFGTAYPRMLAQDPHAPGSVDRVLIERMVRLCPDTVAYLYTAYTPIPVSYRQGSRPELEQYAAQAITGCDSPEARVEGVVRFTAGLADPVVDAPVEALRFGGTEEAIIRRGSDWCTDVARVACVLCQVVGLPARIVHLFNTAHAYSGHVIIEAYRDGRWGAVDLLYGLVYRHPEGTPAPTWEIMQRGSGIVAHGCQGAGSIGQFDAEQFREAAMVNYLIGEGDLYDYPVGGINAYYRSILEMSERGWPGGRRWLHAEDREEA